MANPPVIPQIIVEDRIIANILTAIKQLLDLREGRTQSKGQKFVTHDELKKELDALNKRIDSL